MRTGGSDPSVPHPILVFTGLANIAYILFRYYGSTELFFSFLLNFDFFLHTNLC